MVQTVYIYIQYTIQCTYSRIYLLKGSGLLVYIHICYIVYDAMNYSAMWQCAWRKAIIPG